MTSVTSLSTRSIRAVYSSSNEPGPAAAPAAAPANTGPFTGIYTANYAAETHLDGQPYTGSTPRAETWAVRSVCHPGCVATASRTSGSTALVSTLVFDDVGGRWLAVGLGSNKCGNAPAEYWETFVLQPHSDGTLAGEYITATSSGCDEKRAVTFTRIRDFDVNILPDPAAQPPRVVSPAEALHGRYHATSTYTDGRTNYEHDYAVRTDCLRTSDRCMSYLYSPDDHLGMVFGSGKWTLEEEGDVQCSAGGGTRHSKLTAAYPLPQPPQDPITLLTGHGHQDDTGACTGSSDFDDKFVRTGD